MSQRHSILLLKEARGKPTSETGTEACPGTRNNSEPYAAALNDASLGSKSGSTRTVLDGSNAQSAIGKPLGHAFECTVDYLAPMATQYPESTLLSSRIMTGLPHSTPSSSSSGDQRSRQSNDNLHADQKHKSNTGNCGGDIWAFAITSQNAVIAFERALNMQPDPAIRDAWLSVPVYCLTGATLTSVKKAGFRNINLRNPLPHRSECDQESNSTDLAGEIELINGVQLVDFLLSVSWPTSTEPSKSDPSQYLEYSTLSAAPPELWFLTGETRMNTLPDRLSAAQKPFREITVYETVERPGFAKEMEQWLQTATSVLPASSQFFSSVSTQASSPSNSSCKVETASLVVESDMSSTQPSPQLADGRLTKGEQSDCIQNSIWLVGFSPRGIDISLPILVSFFAQHQPIAWIDSPRTTEQFSTLDNDPNNESCGSNSHNLNKSRVELRWGAIGTTTETRIKEHLLGLRRDFPSASEHSGGLFVNSTVAVATAPTPVSLADAMFSLS